MAKKIKPDLKGYLETGKRGEPSVTTEQAAARIMSLLESAAPRYRETLRALLSSGAALRRRSLVAASLKEDFGRVDQTRFTYYAMTEEGELLCPVRSASQIQDSLRFLFKWDENGELTLYSHDAPEL